MVDKKTIERVARLARINLTEKEIEKFSRDLKSVLDAFKDLEKIGTNGVKPTFQPVPVKNVKRPDKVKPGFTQKQALMNTKNKERGYFKGPRVV